MANSGSCLCGNLTYTYEAEPALKALCHCSECRKLSGGAFTYTYLLPASKFDLKSSSVPPKSHAKKHETGMMLTRYFCPECSTVIYKESDAPDFKGMVILFAGTLDVKEDQVPKPDVEFFVSQKIPWVHGVGAGVKELQQFT
ncbi:hypothetical protein BP6252_07537 [Coleophoma cylindrospora]|uniref:CENP-V/GFA domain-containing protein n=1 Tax=Coleophoma cylindrospora TaxID=1849047 RepID=A0A3D8RAT4_9HELO|nr:hypothetical protein BP6252_07537 [Coleophoma cylindrospora]